MAANQISIRDLLGTDSGAGNWNWREQYVQIDENLATSGLFVASESTLIAFGPAKASPAFDVVKVGLAPNISISQQIPQQRLPEIGSQRVHMLNGVPQGGGSMSRMVYNGPSLMRYAYGNLYDDNGDPTPLALAGMATSTGPAQDFMVNAWKKLMQNSDKVMQGHVDTNLWLSCWDMRLRMPIGICLYFQDTAGNAVGGVYAEGTKIGGHNFSQSAGQMIMMEGIQFGFDRLVPIRGIGRSQL
jgi:hypothetical protein